MCSKSVWERLCDEEVAATTTSVSQKRRHGRTVEGGAVAGRQKVQMRKRPELDSVSLVRPWHLEPLTR